MPATKKKPRESAEDRAVRLRTELASMPEDERMTFLAGAMEVPPLQVHPDVREAQQQVEEVMLRSAQQQINYPRFETIAACGALSQAMVQLAQQVGFLEQVSSIDGPGQEDLAKALASLRQAWSQISVAQAKIFREVE